MQANTHSILENTMTNHLMNTFREIDMNNISNKSSILNNLQPLHSQVYPISFNENLLSPHGSLNYFNELIRISMRETLEKTGKESIHNLNQFLNCGNFNFLPFQKDAKTINLFDGLKQNEEMNNFIFNHPEAIYEELNNINKANQQCLQKNLINFDDYINRSNQNIIDVEQVNFKNLEDQRKTLTTNSLLMENHKKASLLNSNNLSFNQSTDINQFQNFTNFEGLTLNDYIKYLHLNNYVNNSNSIQNDLFNHYQNLKALINMNFLINNVKNNLGKDFNFIAKTNNFDDENFVSLKPDCGKGFENRGILDHHLNTSDCCSKIFRCTAENCGKSYKSKENLKLHIKNKHLGLKPYNCKFCTAKFSHRNGKTYHERKVHLKFLPFTCKFQDCPLSFASKSALKYHTTNQH